jgi:alpha-tubulin suppressor-like RCC1 family protein
MGDSLPVVNLGAGMKAVAIAAGAYYNCALLNDGSVKCWGINGHCELGQGDKVPRGDGPVEEMGDNLPAVRLGAGKTALEIAAGFSSTCARLNDGSVKCWGYNFYGQLGLGDQNDRGCNAIELGDALPPSDLGPSNTSLLLVGGGNHMCAVLQSHRLKCWGYNAYGQLGLGDTDNRGDQMNEMGDNLPVVKIVSDSF